MNWSPLQFQRATGAVETAGPMEIGGIGRLRRLLLDDFHRPLEHLRRPHSFHSPDDESIILSQLEITKHNFYVTPERVQRLQTALHAKAKEALGFRFYSLSDKVWRDDVLAVAWQAVRRNGGAAGVDGETVANIDAFGVDRWLGALARDLKEGTYRPHAVRQVLIPKKQRGKFRPLGIPCLRDRVVQTAAMLVLSPIFEADLQPEQYAYRPGRDAHDAVRRVHRLLTTGHREVVDADLSDYLDPAS